MNSLFPKSTIPYYIVTPPYNDISSGVKTLHLLCHALNCVEQRAHIVLTEQPNEKYPLGVHPQLQTSVTNAISPDGIAIYPDIITDNPLNLRRVIRYLLARPGQFRTYNPLQTDVIWNHSSGIAKEMGHDRVLNIPCTDRSIFYPPRNNAPPRQGACYYAYKYDKIHGNKLLPITDGAVRLEGSPEYLAGVLRRSEVCYVYEISNIIMDSQMCGCPVVLIKTPYFNDVNAMADWRGYGVRWSDAPDIPLAQDERPDWVNQMREEYRGRIFKFWEQLDRFAERSQKWE